MKNAILLVLSLILLQSCSIIKKQKNRLKERVETHVAVKSDSSGVKTADSSSSVKTAATSHSRETSTSVNEVEVAGETMEAKTKIPDAGETQTFETATGYIEVGVDSSGKNISVTAKTKPKKVPVNVNHTKEVWNAQVSDAKTSVAKTEAARVSSSLQVDSGRHTNSVVLNKSVNRVGAWWWWLILVVVVLCYVGFKIYTRGINPILWFK